MGRYIHVAELTGGLVSLNISTTAIGTTDVHGVGFWGVLGVPSIEPLLGGGVRPEGSIPPPPPETKTRQPQYLVPDAWGSLVFACLCRATPMSCVQCVAYACLWSPPGDRTARCCSVRTLGPEGCLRAPGDAGDSCTERANAPTALWSGEGV